MWAFLALSAALLAACAPKGAETLDPAFANYVKAYTGGVVSDGTAIRVELATPVPMDRQTDGLFSFKPALQGSERWLSPTVVEFVPDGWKSGTVYEGSFQVGKVLPVQESQCKVFPFRIQAAPHAAALSLDGVTIRDGARLQGAITLSVPVAKEDITLTVDPSAPVAISGEGTQYHFEAGPIDRSTADIPVKVTLKVKDFDQEVSRKTYIPAAGGFKVIDTRVVRGENPHVEVRFSEPLAATASREGLIELDGVVRQTIDIQDNVARVYFEADPREDLALQVHQGVRSADGQALAEGFRMDLPSTDPAPAVTIPIDGTILPDDSKLVLPFRAVNLSAVDLRVIKIYEDNVLLFDSPDGRRHPRPARLERLQRGPLRPVQAGAGRHLSHHPVLPPGIFPVRRKEGSVHAAGPERQAHAGRGSGLGRPEHLLVGQLHGLGAVRMEGPGQSRDAVLLHG